MSAVESAGYWRTRPRGTPKDLTGEKHQSLTVIGLSHRDKSLGRYIWQCRCECGNEIKVSTGDWNSKRAKSCGCFRFRTGESHPNYRHGKKEASRRTGLKKHYGLTHEEYDMMQKEQNGSCAICGVTPQDRGLYVDHCHDSGKVRGLLCPKCNFGLGNFGDSIKTLSSAIKYLSKYGE